MLNWLGFVFWVLHALLGTLGGSPAADAREIQVHSTTGAHHPASIRVEALDSSSDSVAAQEPIATDPTGAPFRPRPSLLAITLTPPPVSAPNTTAAYAPAWPRAPPLVVFVN